MNILNLCDINDELVIHYGGQLHSVESNTFANSLISLGKIIQEISYQQYPDFGVEVRLETISRGSFRPKIKLHAKTIKAKFSQFLPEKKDTLPILLTLFTIVSSKACSDETKISILEDKISITTANNQIILDKNIYEKAKNIENNGIIQAEISNHFQTILEDSSIDSFGFLKDLQEDDYFFYTTRSHFANFIKPAKEDINIKEEILENQNLSLLKVILERNTRKWEFVWNGIKISAPILDDVFWNNLQERNISIRKGDSIQANLKIYKELDPYSGIYFNKRYEIIQIKNYSIAPPSA